MASLHIPLSTSAASAPASYQGSYQPRQFRSYQPRTYQSKQYQPRAQLYRGGWNYRHHHHHHRGGFNSNQSTYQIKRNAFIAGLKAAKNPPKTSNQSANPTDITKMSDEQLMQIVSMANQINEMKADAALRAEMAKASVSQPPQAAMQTNSN